MCFPKKSALVFLILPMMIFSQSRNLFPENFIPYKFSEQVDSILVKKLDSITEKTVEKSLIIDVLWTSESVKDYYLKTRYEHYTSIRLLFIDNYRTIKDKSYLSYLARNTSRYYVSLNHKYTIPIIFSHSDERFQFDDVSYEKIWIHPRRIFLVILEGFDVVKIDYNMPIPEAFLK